MAYGRVVWLIRRWLVCSCGRSRDGIERQKGSRRLGCPLFKDDLPSDHSQAGRASPRIRFMAMQPMEIVYELSRAARSRAKIALRAAVDPKLMRERRTQTMREIMMALRGMLDLG